MASAQYNTVQPDTTQTSPAQARHNVADRPQTIMYEYEPIQSPTHIRILKLHPGKDDIPLRCSLFQVNLDDGPSFEALSYAWGDAKDVLEIESEGKLITITRNLYKALEQMRYTDVERHMWADAICINQKDVPERSEQVQLMAKIYSQAERVLFWLGPQDDDIVRNALAYLGILDAIVGDRVSTRKQTLEDKQCDRGDDAENAILSLLQCPVFRRGWVIQEVALAKHILVCWGETCFDFKRFAEAVNIHFSAIYEITNSFSETFGDSNPYISLFAFERISSIRSDQQRGEAILPWDLIHDAYPFYFSDERDRIYGLLALAIKSQFSTGDTFVPSDYNIDKQVAFKTFTEACLIREGMIATLLFTNGLDAIIDDRPSWSPDWSNLDPTWADTFDPYERYSRGDVQLPIVKPAENQVLIQGFTVGTVEAVFECSPMDKIEEARTLVRSLCDSFNATSVAQTCLALINVGHMGALKRHADDLDEGLRDIKTKALREYLDLDLSRRPSFLSEFKPERNEIGYWFDKQYRFYNSDQAFFRTNQGMLGLGRKGIREGDTIVMLLGQQGPRLPFILRTFGEAWKLVSQCYIQDLCNGFAVKRWKESGEPAEGFILC